MPSTREQIWRVIFLSDTPAGRRFDRILLWLITANVLTVVVESVESCRAAYGPQLALLEWIFTAIFTLEYFTRLAVAPRPGRYATSFFGIIDLAAILPSWLDLVLPDAHYLMALRVMRLLRMFRVLELAGHVDEASVLLAALQASRRKIAVFFVFVISLVCVEGTIMYVLEHGPGSKFDSIPQSIYWAIVTLTTVGYGDISPVTVAGKIMASIVMLTGFAIIAVPTGIVSSELTRGRPSRCPHCGHEL